MNSRYKDDRIEGIWSNDNKVNLWQKTELAVIQARANLGIIDENIFDQIHKCLLHQPIDIAWWLAKEEEVKHDLNAFLEERLRFLPLELQPYFHNGMTSYDTEESAFLQMIFDSIFVFDRHVEVLCEVLKTLALRYRYTIMNGRTHGQEAQLQSFGKRCLTLLQSINLTSEYLIKARSTLRQSKLSGAIGNYGGLNHEVEKEALRILGFKPFYGATQIIPRELFAPIAQALCQLVLTLDKIAIDIRLGARSGRPIYQEPFGKKQKGSSVMPHKKNTISTEQMKGMARMAKSRFLSIQENIETWEERAIEQSCVERVEWPDLFHIAIHCLKTMIRVLGGLKVYPDNMLLEIEDSCGCYAAGEAKEFLRHRGAPFGLSTEDAYRIVQLSAFNAFEPEDWAQEMRNSPHISFKEADNDFFFLRPRKKKEQMSIKEIITRRILQVSPQLEANQECVDRWNNLLKTVFESHEAIIMWDTIFKPSYLLRGEETLYREILGE